MSPGVEFEDRRAARGANVDPVAVTGWRCSACRSAPAVVWRINRDGIDTVLLLVPPLFLIVPASGSSSSRASRSEDAAAVAEELDGAVVRHDALFCM